MCGIVGAIGNLTIEDEARFKHMLIVDQLRGTDGVGVVGVHRDLSHTVVKKNMDPHTFISAGGISKITVRQNIALIGHNRAATFGSVTDENCHPFQRHHITGVHNGSLWDSSPLEPLGMWFDVDSDAVMHSIAINGLKYTWANLCGAAALVWWDDESKTINFIRNKERPLHYAITNTGNLFFMSEEGMLRMMMERYCLRYSSITSYHIGEFKVDHHYQIDPLSPTLKHEDDGKKMISLNANITKLEPSVRVEPTYYGWGKPVVGRGAPYNNAPVELILKNNQSFTRGNIIPCKYGRSNGKALLFHPVMIDGEADEEVKLELFYTPTKSERKTLEERPELVYHIEINAVFSASNGGGGMLRSSDAAWAIQEAATGNVIAPDYEDDVGIDTLEKCWGCNTMFPREEMVEIYDTPVCKDCAEHFKSN